VQKLRGLVEKEAAAVSSNEKFAADARAALAEAAEPATGGASAGSGGGGGGSRKQYRELSDDIASAHAGGSAKPVGQSTPARGLTAEQLRDPLRTMASLNRKAQLEAIQDPRLNQALQEAAERNKQPGGAVAEPQVDKPEGPLAGLGPTADAIAADAEPPEPAAAPIAVELPPGGVADGIVEAEAAEGEKTP